MICKTYSGRLAVALLIVGSASASNAADPDPLFAASDVLDARLSAPFEQIMQERAEEQDIPGMFELVAADGSSVEFDVGIQSRGNFRRRKDICQFAPLRINFKKSQLDASVFDGQDKLKLVTHCENGSRNYQQAVLKEYLAYRILNAVTDISFRVRLLRMTYVATDHDNRETTSYAFFIESDERLAKRIDMKHRRNTTMSVVLLQPDYMNLTSVFHFLIGNLDFSPVMGAINEVCCHNHTLFSADETTFWSVPYDFDISGFVAAPHAQPNPRLKQKSLRQRIYRGRCVNNDRLPTTLQLFRERRAAIEAILAAQQELEKGTRRSVETYIASFYKEIDHKRALDELTKACI